MYAHFSWYNHDAVVNKQITEIFARYEINSTYNGQVGISGEFWSPSEKSYFTLHQNRRIRGTDVLLANMFRELWLLQEANPHVTMHWSNDCHNDKGDWFVFTDDSIYYNMLREGSYMYRNCDVEGCRAGNGKWVAQNLRSVYVLGEPNAARRTLKRIRKEAAEATAFLDLTPGGPIMELAGQHVIVLVHAVNGQFQVINDGIVVTVDELIKADSAPGITPRYSFLYNNPVFKK